jgi:protease I
MSGRPLAGRKIAVIVENKFIPEEISAYQFVFPALGATVDLVSRIWWGDYKPKSTTYYSDVDPSDSQPWESPQPLTVMCDVSQIKPGDYSAVIMSANYTSVRLRWENLPEPFGDPRAYVRSAPLVRFFADAMRDKHIVKGALCHGLWILTPNPELLRGRRVTCHAVVMADILNCGAEIVMDVNPRVVTDEDLVTGFSKHEVLPFIEAISDAILARS